MSGVNRAIIIGHLGGDPDVRATQDGGRKIARFSVATSETWRDRDTGERKERTDWHRVVVFNDRLANVAADYLRKGSKVYVEGAMRTRSYQEEGVTKYVTEVVLGLFNSRLVLLDKRGGGRPPDDDNEPVGEGPQQETRIGTDLDDEIPF